MCVHESGAATSTVFWIISEDVLANDLTCCVLSDVNWFRFHRWAYRMHISKVQQSHCDCLHFRYFVCHFSVLSSSFSLSSHFLFHFLSRAYCELLEARRRSIKNELNSINNFWLYRIASDHTSFYSVLNTIICIDHTKPWPMLHILINAAFRYVCVWLLLTRLYGLTDNRHGTRRMYVHFYLLWWWQTQWRRWSRNVCGDDTSLSLSLLWLK